MHTLDPDSVCSVNIDKGILEKGSEQIFEYIQIVKNLQEISEHNRSSKNPRTNIRIFLYWGNCTNTNTNNILGPFYSNIRILEYLRSSLQISV